MASQNCTVNTIHYSRSDWTGRGWQDDGDHRSASGYAHTRASSSDWGWWFSRIVVTIPQFNGLSQALVLKVKTDSNSYPLNSYAILSTANLSAGSVGYNEWDKNIHKCSCGTNNNHYLFRHDPKDKSKFHSDLKCVTSSFAYLDEGATKVPERDGEDANGNVYKPTLYYRFNSSALSNGTYYIYMLYKHHNSRGSNKHGFVAGNNHTEANVTAYLLYENQKTLTINAKINGDLVNTFSEYATVTLDGKTCSTTTNKLAYNKYYTIGVSVPSNKINYYEYVGTSPITGTLSGDTTKTLEFKTKSKIVFDKQGGSTTINPIYKTRGTAITLPSISRSGYSFSGWYTAASGGSKVGGAGASYTTDPSKPLKDNKIDTSTYQTTLYARWSANTYTVSFNANGGTVSPTTKSVTYASTYGTLPTASLNGYDFDGWYTSKSGGTKVTSSTTVSTTSNHTLYAHWNIGQYTLNYDANGGTVSPSSKSITYNGTYGTLPTPTRNGYNFTGWYTAKSGGTKVTSTTAVSTTGDRTIYAHWSLNTYTISYNANGGSGAPSKQTKDHGETLTLSNQIPTKSNKTIATYTVTYNYNGSGQSNTSDTSNKVTVYTFSTWNTKADGTGTSYNKGASYSGNADVTLYARYSSTDTTSAVTLDTPNNRPGYKFDGWYTATSGGTCIGGAGDSYIPSANKTLYARWSYKKYTITFNTHGGTLQPNTSSYNVTYNSTYGSLPSSVLVGHTFKGWYTSASGGTKIDDNTKVTITDNQTLHAQYDVVSYKVSYYNGTTLLSSETVKYGNNFTTYRAAVKPGEKFKNWTAKTTTNITVTLPAESTTEYNYACDLKFTAVFDGNIPKILVKDNKSWKVVVPHVYKNGEWKPTKLNLTDDGVFQQFEYHNWLS